VLFGEYPATDLVWAANSTIAPSFVSLPCRARLNCQPSSNRISKSKSKSKLCYDRQSVGQSFLVSSTHLGLKTRFFLLSQSCWFVDVGRSLWRENGSAVYIGCWPSSAQSFSGPSFGGLLTIICLRSETPPTWRATSPFLYPPGTGWPIYTPRHLLRLSRLWWSYSNPPPRGVITEFLQLSSL
jgi:hypothetical protein